MFVKIFMMRKLIEVAFECNRKLYHTWPWIPKKYMMGLIGKVLEDGKDILMDAVKRFKVIVKHM